MFKNGDKISGSVDTIKEFAKERSHNVFEKMNKLSWG